MSSTTPLSVMIDWRGDTSALVKLLGALLGQNLVARSVDESIIYAAVLLDTELLLIPDHGLEDDGSIQFSRYTHQLQLIALDSGRFLASYAALYEHLSLFLAERVSTALSCSTELVANLQTSRARFHVDAI